MPWTVKDVPRFKKGLTAAQAKKWVSIANGALKACQKKGGKDCEGSAIRIANSKFMKEKQVMSENRNIQKVPKGALRFVETGEGLQAFAIVKEDGGKPKLNMIAYTGKVIKGHWYWDNLAIDLDGMKFPVGKFPILENHDTDNKIAFTSKPIIEDNQLRIDGEKTTFVDTEAAAEFIKLSGEGFPYQSSIYAKPTEIQRLMKDETAEVNGMKLRGPNVTIWRKCEFKEASVCVFGWDSQTKASAFSRDEMEEIELEGGDEDYLGRGAEDDEAAKQQTDTNTGGGEKQMDLNELREKHPDLVTALTQEVTDSVTSTLTTEFDKERAKFAAQEAKSEERMAQLEKKDALRDEKDRQVAADRIWDKKLAESDVSEHLFDKVRAMVSYSKFVKDDIFDEEAFSTAVDEEIKDWVKRGAVQQVRGTGFTQRTEEEEESVAAVKTENTKLTNDLLSRVGQSVEAT